MADGKHLYLIDGSGFIFRAFHALPPLTRPDGTPVGAVYGFTNMLLRLLERAAADADLDYIAVIFDAARKTFRQDIYAGYKAHRPDTPPDLIPQFDLVRQATRACNVPAIELLDFEADDLIASYATAAKNAGMRVTVVSGDKDLMQLIDGAVGLFDPIKNKKIDEAAVIEKFGVPPNQVIEVQALAGDSSDNVPGVPGIGVKTAAELIAQFGTVENLLANAASIKQPKRREALQTNADNARISKQLVTLRHDAPLPLPIADLIARPIDQNVLREFLQAQGFKALVARLGESRESRVERREETPPITNDSPPTPHSPPPTLHYQLLQTADSLREFLKPLDDGGVLAIDCETDSLHAVSANLVGIALATAPGVAAYIPLAHRWPDADLTTAHTQPPLQQISMAECAALLKPYLQNPAVKKILHNAKYDFQIFDRYDLPIDIYDDTMLLSYVLYGGQHGHGMDELAEKYLGHTTIKFTDVVGTGKKQITFDLVPLDRAMQYAAEDADVTLRLWHFLYPQLPAQQLTALYEHTERGLPRAVAGMESAGVLVDRMMLHRLSAEFGQKLREFEAEIYALAGGEFNIASPKQMGEVLFEKLKLPGGGKTKTGAWSTDVGVMEDLASSGHVIADKILSWRQMAKLISTYTDALVDEINPKTGRVHSSFHIAATNTGRFSSTAPNLQNIPIRTEEGKKIRTAFMAAPDHVLLSADYSQIELRLMADMAGVPALRQAFLDGVDIHTLTASQVFHVPLADVGSDLRRNAKAINFGIIYGISAFGLAKQLGCGNNEAKDFIDRYFARFPEIRDFMDAQKQFARDHGYVLTRFGRKCFMPEIQSKNAALRNFAERQAINAPLQGTAADVIRRAMIHLPPALQAAGLQAKMILQVHDELVLELPKSEAEATSTLVRDVMQSAPLPAVQLSLPLVVDTTIAERWS
jgi:DNA polymerase-1